MGGRWVERAPGGAAVTSATAQDHLVNCHIFKGVELVAWRGCLSTTARGRPHDHLALLHKLPLTQDEWARAGGLVGAQELVPLYPALSCMFPHWEHPGVGRGLDTPA